MVLTEETKIKISVALFGRRLSEANKINIGLSNKGKVRSKELRLLLSEKGKGKHLTEENGNWKGDDVKYSGLHKWVKRNFGAPKVCEHCSNQESVQWANKNHNYTRDREDWFELCASCHKLYDIQKKKEDDVLLQPKLVQ